MNVVYRVSNSIVAAMLVACAGYAIYSQAPQVFQAMDEAVVSSVAVVGLVGALVVGFLASEARKV